MKTPLKAVLLLVFSICLLFIGYLFGFAHGSLGMQRLALTTSTSQQLKAADLLRSHEPEKALHLLEQNSVDIALNIEHDHAFSLIPSGYISRLLSDPKSMFFTSGLAMNAIQVTDASAENYASKFPDYVRNTK